MHAWISVRALHHAAMQEYGPLIAALRRQWSQCSTRGLEWHQCQEQVRKLVEEMQRGVFFEDINNGNNLAHLLGFDWAADIGPLLNDCGDLMPIEVKALHARLLRSGGRLNRLSEDREYYLIQLQRYNRLMDLIENAIRSRQPIRISLFGD